MRPPPQRPARDEQAPAIRRRPAVAGNEFEGFAIVREILPVTDVFERLGAPRTTMGSAVLGELARGNVTQVTAHAPVGDGTFDSYTFFIPSQRLTRERVRLGAQVRVRLEAGRVPGRGAFWRCAGIALVE